MSDGGGPPTGPDRPLDAPVPEPEAPPRTVAMCRAGGSILIGVGAVGVAIWLWTAIRSQIASDDIFLFSARDAGWEYRVDVLAASIPLAVESTIAAGLGLALRLIADYTSSRSGWPTPVARRSRRPAAWVVGGVSAVVLVAVVAALLAGGDDEGDSVADLDASGFEDAVRERLEDEADRERLDDLRARDLPSWTDQPPEAAVDLPESETLTVHTDGCGVIRTDNSDGALDLTWVVSDVDGFQVLGRNANGETRYRYFQPGTYTVVLETFGADSYVPVSNTVTINC